MSTERADLTLDFSVLRTFQCALFDDRDQQVAPTDPVSQKRTQVLRRIRIGECCDDDREHGNYEDRKEPAFPPLALWTVAEVFVGFAGH